VNLRDKPGLDSNVIGHVPFGTKITPSNGRVPVVCSGNDTGHDSAAWVGISSDNLDPESKKILFGEANDKNRKNQFAWIQASAYVAGRFALESYATNKNGKPDIPVVDPEHVVVGVPPC
jgi:hypothetical protein